MANIEFQGVSPAVLARDFVQQGQVVLDLGKQTGVDTTGATECGTATQTALDAALALGARVFARGTIKTATPLTITCSADLSDLTINYVGASNGIAVRVGAGTSGTILFRKTVRLPEVINANKTTTGWAQTGVAGTTGVQLVNCYACEIHVPHVENFETGLSHYGIGTGHVYNLVHVGHLDNNKINEYLSADSTGWTNDNHIFGGIRSYLSGEGTAVSGTRAILIAAATNQINNNRWYGGSVEGVVAEYHLDCAGGYNTFHDVRWEVTGGARVQWNTAAVYNAIHGGYKASSIVETFTSAGAGNSIVGHQVARIRSGPGTSGLVQYENGTSSANPAVVIMEAGAGAAGADPTTAWALQAGAQTLNGKRAADAAARFQADFVNGRLYFGPGTGAPTKYIGNNGSDVGVSGANWVPATDASQDLGGSTQRWRHVYLSGGVNTGINTYTTSVTLGASDGGTVLMNNSGAATLTLPSATTNKGKSFRIRSIAAGAVTVASAAGNVDGSSTQALGVGGKALYQSDGTNWWSV